MNKVRLAAELLIEHGKALGHAGQAASTVAFVESLSSVVPEEPSTEHCRQVFAHELERLKRHQGELEKHAAWALQQARQLMHDVEHPGAVLARRLIATWRGARAAWRGSR